MQAGLLDLSATWTKRIDSFIPRDISISGGYPHYLLARPDLEKLWDMQKAQVEALPIYFIKGVCI